jgi:hypothetical protein
MADRSARVTHERGNRRFHDYVFVVVDDVVEELSFIGADQVAVFDECPHCEGAGCQHCGGTGFVKGFIPDPLGSR